MGTHTAPTSTEAPGGGLPAQSWASTAVPTPGTEWMSKREDMRRMAPSPAPLVPAVE